MGYANTIEVNQLLPQALTSARPNPVGGGAIEIIGIGNTRDFNRIPDDVVLYYISLGDNEIDGILSQMYQTPLRKCANGEWAVDAPIYASSSPGTDGTDGEGEVPGQIIELSTSVNLLAGDEIIIRDDDTGLEEHHIVNTVEDQYRITTFSPILNTFDGENVRVIRIQYPPPINQISARLAASFIYDKYFSAQSDPNVSEYGNAMRSIAMGQINDILNGRVILKGQRRVGDLFGNPWLDSNYSIRRPPEDFDTNSRDRSKNQ